MKILKLLSSFFFIFFLFFKFGYLYSNEPVDIWKINKEKKKSEIESEIINSSSETIFQTQTEKLDKIDELKSEELQQAKLKLAGIYEPTENGLTIDMWSRSGGEEIKSLLKNISQINLSNDSKEILEVALLTNAYLPDKNIQDKEFLNFVSDYLIKKKDLNLIKLYIKKNESLPINSILATYYANQFLANSDVNSACEIFNDKTLLDDNYLLKFNIYCLLNDQKREEAQLLFDLKKEQGFKDDFFEKKFNSIMGYESKEDENISDENILNFHLSHLTIENFLYLPNKNTSKIIWKYLSSSNLLEKIDNVDLEDIKKVKMIEQATHDKNYEEKELLDLYKRFQFNINQLLTAEESYNILPSYEGRALLYQKLLLTSEISKRLELLEKLKNSFLKDKIDNAFEVELSKLLNQINPTDIPSNYSTFYSENLIVEEIIKSKIKFNNKIIHQSKLLNYFLKEIKVEKVEKDTNDLLKKIKKDKKYFVSNKDIILIESLKSDGVKISKKYEDLYDPYEPDIPLDIQLLINNRKTGQVLLRLVEIIGEDQINDLGIETLGFIISTLNSLDMDIFRNKILLKVLPLKV